MANKNQSSSTESTQTLLGAEMQQRESGISNITIQPPVKEVSANVVLKLADTTRQGGVNLDGQDFVYDPATDKQRKVRLIKGVATIFADEQEKLDKAFVEKNIRSLQFENKICILQPHDKTAIQFAELCNSNLDNDSRFGHKPIYFTIWNPLKDAEREEAAEMRLIEAMQVAATMQTEKMYRHAVYLGISLFDAMGNKATEKAVRTLYLKAARTSPDKFLKGAENPVVEYSFAIKTFLANGTLDTEKQQGQIYWQDGGFICTVPPNEDTVKYLENFIMSDTESGQNFKERIKSLSRSI